MDQVQASDDISNIDVDALLQQAETPQEIPMEAPAPETLQTPPQQAQVPEQKPQASQTYTINHNGKQINATIEQLTQWASQGYNYSQQMQALKQQQQELEAIKPYKQIDEYAKQNPEWWNTVMQAWEQRNAQAQKLDPNNPLAQEISTLKQQLSQFEQFKNQLLEERTKAQYQQEDEALNKEIQSIREKNSDLDWNTLNEQGHNLEQQILHHAAKRGIGNFEDAFKSYYFDKALAQAELRGKESLTKSIQKNTKLGLLGKSPTPSQVQPSTGVKGKSYDGLLKEALDELGLAQ